MAVIALFCGAVLASLESLLLTTIAFVVLVISIAPYWLPTHYTLTEEYVEERRLGRIRRRKWGDLRRVEVGAGLALVSPFSRPSWLDRHRGMMLLLDGADRDAVERMLRERIGAK